MAANDGTRRRSASRATIRDVALRAGVSVATVSRVLNGHPDVSEATRALVLRYIRDEGYVSNRSARGLASGHTGLIALTVPYIHAEYFNEIISGAAEALYEHDARLVLCPTAHDHDREVSLLDRLLHGTTDGALLILPSESNAELVRLREGGVAFVVVDSALPLDDAIPVVGAAHWSGARMATDHLISLGHRRIGVITGPRTWNATIDRLAGFRTALATAGLPDPTPELLCEGDFQEASGYQAAQTLLGRPDRPTAIFAFNDNMAVGVLRAARERGIEVPRELSVVGFDDVHIARLISPPLTTVRQPLREMGRVAAGVLYRLLNRQSLEVARVELSNRLVVRDSTAAPKRMLSSA